MLLLLLLRVLKIPSIEVLLSMLGFLILVGGEGGNPSKRRESGRMDDSESGELSIAVNWL